MANVKLAIIYYSSTGTNYQLARWAEEAAKEAGAEVKVVKVPELAPKEAGKHEPGEARGQSGRLPSWTNYQCVHQRALDLERDLLQRHRHR